MEDTDRLTNDREEVNQILHTINFMNLHETYDRVSRAYFTDNSFQNGRK